MPEPSRARTARRLAIVALLLVAALAAAELGFEALRWRRSAAARARWIWSPAASAEAGPTAFYAVRDFTAPAGRSPATLLVQGDEEYQVLLNGVFVGAGGYRDGAPLDRYRVDELLAPAVNRLSVEARSGRGLGGLLVQLDFEGAPEAAIGSGGDWTIVAEFDPALLDPALPPPAGQPARVWAAPPTGRWGTPEAGPLRPLFPELLTAASPLLPPRARRGGAEEWVAVEHVDWRAAPLGTRATFDFGRETTAYLNLVFAEDREARALYWLGTAEPGPTAEPAAGYAVKLAGARSWSASAPRRFRYVTAWGTVPLTGARAFEVLVPLEPAEPGAAGAGGVFGLAVPPLQSPAQDEIRRVLEGVPGDPAGQPR